MFEDFWSSIVGGVVPYIVAIIPPAFLALLALGLWWQVTAKFSARVNEILVGFGDFWAWACRPILLVIARCIVPVIGIAMVALALLLSDQGSDMLQAFAEDAGPRRFAKLLAAIAIWSLVNAAWGNLMLHVEPSQNIANRRRLSSAASETAAAANFRKTLERCSARTLTAAPFVVMGIAAATSTKPGSVLFISLYLYCVFGVFLAFFVTRSRLQRLLPDQLAARVDAVATKIVQWIRNHSRSAPRSPLLPFFLMTLSLTTSGYVALYVIIDPIAVGEFFRGPITLLCFATATWVAVGCGIHWCAYRYSLPLLRALLVVALVSGSLNDYYPIRSLNNTADDNKPVKAERIEFGKALNTWAERAKPTGNIQPIVIVATAGGALRAAHWTTTVLGELGQTMRTFPRDLFAVSGVSGGAVGASFYRAWLYEQECSLDRAPSNLIETLADQLSGDYLSPLGAAMLYPDFAKTFMGVKVDIRINRAIAIEMAMEQYWPDSPCSSNPMKSAFTTLGGSSAAPSPYLFLNATAVQSGRRVVASPVIIDDSIFPNAVDMLSVIGGDVALSTAANSSARFPLFEPAASLYFDCGREDGPVLPEADKERLKETCEKDPSAKVLWDRIVDGGHFENFGASTAADILERVQAWKSLNGLKNVVPIVIVISSDPALRADDLRQEIVTPGDDPLWFAPELVSQPYALAMSRESRGARAVHDLKEGINVAEGVNLPTAFFYHFRLDSLSSKATLNWMLSGVARAAIRDNWKSANNQAELDRLKKLYGCFEQGYRAMDDNRKCIEPSAPESPTPPPPPEPLVIGDAIAKCRPLLEPASLIKLTGCRKVDGSIYFSTGKPELDTDKDNEKNAGEEDDHASYATNLATIRGLAGSLCTGKECGTPSADYVAVVGSADSQDKETYNIQLSLERATAVIDALGGEIKGRGLIAPKMCTVALGEIEATAIKAPTDRRADVYDCRDLDGGPLDILTSAGPQAGSE